jgi:hypothetical protein
MELWVSRIGRSIMQRHRMAVKPRGNAPTYADLKLGRSVRGPDPPARRRATGLWRDVEQSAVLCPRRAIAGRDNVIFPTPREPVSMPAATGDDWGCLIGRMSPSIAPEASRRGMEGGRDAEGQRLGASRPTAIRMEQRAGRSVNPLVPGDSEREQRHARHREGRLRPWRS